MTQVTRPKDICERLEVIASLKRGDCMPDWLAQDNEWSNNNWGKGLTRLLREAKIEIEMLRVEVQLMSKK